MRQLVPFCIVGVYGNGDFAKQIYWYFKSDTSFDVVAFCADKKYISDKEIYGLIVYLVNMRRI
mgnify:CR=1 FL=1